MGQFLPFAVDTFDADAHSHRLGEFARLPVAISAARHSLEDQRIRLAVVKDAHGVMVYAADTRAEWSDREGVMPRT
jgi:hypothetical protein